MEPRCKELLGMANDFLRPSDIKIYEKSPSITKPSYSEHILPVQRTRLVRGIYKTSFELKTVVY